jgi:hypothetical protein
MATTFLCSQLGTAGIGELVTRFSPQPTNGLSVLLLQMEGLEYSEL